MHAISIESIRDPLRRLRRSISLIAGIALLSPVSAQQAPQTIELKPATSCRNCTIKVTRAATLREGGSEQHGGLTSAAILAWDSRGHFYVINGVNRGQILVFDRTGQFLQVLGRTGGGPGEFQSIGSIHVGLGETVHVFDQAARSYTKLTASFQVAGTANVGIDVEEAIQLRPGEMVVNSEDGTREGFGYPLRLFDQKTLGRPFGSTDALTRTAMGVGRQLAWESASTFWAAHEMDYIIDLWSTTGALQKQFVRKAEWFKKADRLTLEGRLNPTVYDLQRDSLGRLWIIFGVRSSRFHELAFSRGEMRSTGIPILASKTGDMADLIEGIIEVVDPNRGEVIASLRLPRTVQRFAGPGIVTTYNVDELGRGIVSMMRVELVSPQSPSRR